MLRFLEASIQKVINFRDSLLNGFNNCLRNILSTVHEGVVFNIFENLICVGDRHVFSMVICQVLVFFRNFMQETFNGGRKSLFVQLYSKNYIKSCKSKDVFCDRNLNLIVVIFLLTIGGHFYAIFFTASCFEYGVNYFFVV